MLRGERLVCRVFDERSAKVVVVEALKRLGLVVDRVLFVEIWERTVSVVDGFDRSVACPQALEGHQMHRLVRKMG